LSFIVVFSDGTGWGCIYEYGDTIMERCTNATSPANTTSMANMHSCR